MDIVDGLKFVIGILFAIVGAALLAASHHDRGFGQRRQAGVLALIASGIFFAIGLGYMQGR